MSGARYLKLRATWGQGPGHRGAINSLVCVNQLSTLFSCRVHQQDVAWSGDRVPGRAVREGGETPNAKTLCFWMFNKSRIFGCFF